MIAITGASGHLGKATIGFLINKIDPANIIAVVRDPEKMKDFPGIQVRVADYDDAASLRDALSGVKTLLQISSASYGDHATQQEKNVVDAASGAGVQHIVYTSTVNPGSQPIFFGSQTNQHTENAIRASGITYTFFRNSMYMETIPQFIGSAMEDGQIFYPAGEGKVSFVARTDIAEALANVLAAGEKHANAAYDITGTGAYSFSDIATLLASEKGLPASYTDIPASAFRDELVKLEMPPIAVDFYISMADSVKAGEFAHVDGALEGLLQRKRVVLKDYVRSL
ncbi:SDR family oxidoreductase [Chitinophaga lutea]|uniref:SDR family oxidoreductase n=1 Tax=Chitinophaga lutea TaxID=2488634 RepID=A0A3N4PQQ1_9BACT|nr:SDR family oxidoreductase [Chitinophaga lutea]RPE06050.1 SDR family oxidoreductase [Chitinophaga lutea]